MGLQTIDPKGWRRAWKKHRSAQRRRRWLERGVVLNVLVSPLMRLIDSLTKLVKSFVGR